MGGVTLGENLQLKADVLTLQAMETSDKNLRAFYINASLGYKLKMQKLTVSELSKIVRAR